MIFEDDVHGDRVECERMARESRLDYWDQPHGPWESSETNSRYRLGGRALARYDDTADMWLRRAAEDGHPGAAFRMALWALRQSADEEAIAWLNAASFRGHHDADFLLASYTHCQDRELIGDDAAEVFHMAATHDCQDPAFALETGLLLAKCLEDPEPPGCD
ncbi:hypothetical protein ACWGHD_19240 [Streptomyces xanthophaeus]